MAKIDLKEYENKEFTNKYGERYKVLNYLFKDKSNYCYDIEFTETHNRQMATLTQIRNGTCRDIAERKKLKRLKVELQLRERNRLVIKAKKVCVIPDNLHEKNILAIDLATHHTGIAYSFQGKILRWGLISATNDRDHRKRSFEIVEKIIDILKTGKINFIIIEDVFLGYNSDVLMELTEIRGMLMYHIQKMKIDYLIISAVLWKNKYKGIPATRKEQKQFMIDKFFEFTGEIPRSDDAADAYCMLRACLKGGEQ